MIAIELMEGSCHLPKAFIRKYQYYFRRLERGAFGELPGKVIRADAHHRANLVKGIHP